MSLLDVIAIGIVMILPVLPFVGVFLSVAFLIILNNLTK